MTRTKSSRLDNLTGDLSRVTLQKNPTEIGGAFLFNVKIEGIMVIPREVLWRLEEGKLFFENIFGAISSAERACRARRVVEHRDGISEVAGSIPVWSSKNILCAMCYIAPFFQLL